MNKYRAYIKYLLEAISPKVINRMKEQWKQENNALTDGMMDYYIRSFEKYKSSDKVIEKDITKYSFKELEKVIDSNFIQHRKQQENKISNESIYNQDGLIIYEAPNRESCVSIGKGEKWCISRTDASNMYNSYRFALQEPNFYFIKNERLPSNNKWSFFVLMALNNGYYSLASRDNSGDFTGSKQISWEDVLKNVPFLKDVKDLFKSRPLTEFEKEVYKKVKPKVSNNDLLEHFGSLYLVGEYIGIGHSLSSNQFLNLNNPELRMKYINQGHDLLENEVIQSLTSSEMNRYISVMVQVGRYLNLRSLTSLPNNIKFPETIEGELDLINIKLLPNNITFPKSVGGYLNLYELTSLPNNITFPETIGGYLSLNSLTSLPDNFKFPKTIGRYLDLDDLTSLPDNITFPEMIGGDLYFKKLKEIPQEVWGNMTQQVKSKVPDDLKRSN